LQKLGKAPEIGGIPNKCLRHLPRRPLVHLTHLINHCVQLSHLPTSWKEVIAYSKPGKDPRFHQNLCLESLLSRMGKIFEKTYSKNYQKDMSKDRTCLMQINLVSMHATA
jgi:hypothetical protein